MINAPWILNFVFWTIGIGVPALQNIKKLLAMDWTKTRFNLTLLVGDYIKKSLENQVFFENSFKLSIITRKNNIRN